MSGRWSLRNLIPDSIRNFRFRNRGDATQRAGEPTLDGESTGVDSGDYATRIDQMAQGQSTGDRAAFQSAAAARGLTQDQLRAAELERQLAAERRANAAERDRLQREANLARQQQPAAAGAQQERSPHRNPAAGLPMGLGFTASGFIKSLLLGGAAGALAYGAFKTVNSNVPAKVMGSLGDGWTKRKIGAAATAAVVAFGVSPGYNLDEGLHMNPGLVQTTFQTAEDFMKNNNDTDGNKAFKYGAAGAIRNVFVKGAQNVHGRGMDTFDAYLTSTMDVGRNVFHSFISATAEDLGGMPARKPGPSIQKQSAVERFGGHASGDRSAASDDEAPRYSRRPAVGAEEGREVAGLISQDAQGRPGRGQVIDERADGSEIPAPRQRQQPREPEIPRETVEHTRTESPGLTPDQYRVLGGRFILVCTPQIQNERGDYVDGLNYRAVERYVQPHLKQINEQIQNAKADPSSPLHKALFSSQQNISLTVPAFNDAAKDIMKLHRVDGMDLSCPGLVPLNRDGSRRTYLAVAYKLEDFLKQESYGVTQIKGNPVVKPMTLGVKG